MTSFSIYVPGTPVAQPRPRFNRHTGHAYNDGKADEWKQAVVLAWLEKYSGEVFPAGPYRISAEFFFPRPKSHYNAKGLKKSAPLDHTAKPDLDNLAKAPLDALVRAELIPDDSHCVEMRISKAWVLPSVAVGMILSVHT